MILFIKLIDIPNNIHTYIYYIYIYIYIYIYNIYMCVCILLGMSINVMNIILTHANYKQITLICYII